MNIRSVGSSIVRGAKSFVREFKREYSARQLAAGYKALQRQDEALSQMTPAQQTEYHKDVEAILARAHELAEKQ